MPTTGNGGAAPAAWASRNSDAMAGQECGQLCKRTIAIAWRGSLFGHIALPVFQARTRETLRVFPDFCHLLRRHGLELLRDPDIIFNLSDGSATQRQAVNRQAEHV